MSDTSSNGVFETILVENEASKIHWTKVDKKLIEYYREKGMDKYFHTDEETNELKCMIIDMEGYKSGEDEER